MAGYSGTPLVRKLGITEGSRVLLDSAPEGFEEMLEPIPPSAVILRRAPRSPVDVVVAFRTTRAALLRTFDRDVARTTTAGALWVVWPKKSAQRSPKNPDGVPSDLTEDIVRAAALAAGVVDVKVCAVDETWSALKLVRRLRDR
jgi:hypothetical protein